MAKEFFTLVTTALEAPAPAPENYIAIPGIPSSAAAALPAFAGLSAKEYQTIGAMTDDGFSPTGFEVLSATNLITQSTPTPVTRWVVISLLTFVAQVEEFTVNASADGTYELFLAPAVGLSPVLAATFAAVANTVTEIKDGLLASFAVGAFSTTHTGASVDADSGSITANTAGAAFVLTGSGPGGTGDITVLNTTPNTGMFESFTPAFQTAKFWDVLPEPGLDDGILLEASRWAEDSKIKGTDRRNIAHLQSSEAGIPDVGDLDNLALTLQLLIRTRTFLVYHVSDSDYMTASTFGLYGGQQPGSRAWHQRQIVAGTTLTTTIGPTVFTVEVNQVLVDRNVAWIEREGPSASDPVVHDWGQGSGGFFVEQKQAEDFWWLEVVAAMDAIQKSVAGWTLDETGIQTLADGVNLVNIKLAGFTPPVLDLANTTVVPTPLADIPPAELAVGDYQTTGGINVAAQLIPRGRSLAVDAVFATA